MYGISIDIMVDTICEYDICICQSDEILERLLEDLPIPQNLLDDVIDN